jgi:hypothetical protein
VGLTTVTGILHKYRGTLAIVPWMPMMAGTLAREESAK